MDLSYYKDKYNFKNNYFNLIEFKKIKEYLNQNNKAFDKEFNEEINKEFNQQNKNNTLCSIKHFYMLYPKFDILFYKKIYYNENYKDDLEYLIDYFEHKKKSLSNIKYYSIDNFEEHNLIDYNFLIIFYDNFKTKNKIDIVKEIIYDIYHNNNLYFLSINEFMNKYPNFNINIFKNFYEKLEFENDIEYVKYWHKNNNLISSINDIINIFNFNINLFKEIYNLYFKSDEYIIQYWIKNKDNYIFSIETFYKEIDDFNFNLFIKHFPNMKLLNKKELIKYYIENIKNINYIYSIKQFYIKYPNFNINEYKRINNLQTNFEFNLINDFFKMNKKITENILNDPKFNLKIYSIFCENKIFYENKNIIYSIETFYKAYPNFNTEIYLLINNLNIFTNEDIIIHFYRDGIPKNLPYNEYTIPNFNLNIYKNLNLDLINLSNRDLVLHWLNKGKYEIRIYSIETYNLAYPNILLYDEEKIIKWMREEIYIENKNKNIIGREIVNNIYEVLIDLKNPTPKKELEKGISLIIRAKNEEININYCINSVIDLVDEIIFIDNNSSDKTLDLIKQYKNNKIKIYEYKINVSKVGIEHNQAIKNNNYNTLGNFYNWCLSKSTKNNIFKWDADFICLKYNFIQLVNIYNLRNREDKFAIWFTGCTLFENNNKFYINPDSYYNEYRIFSFKNNFCWYDGEVCEYTEPYINSCDLKYIYKYPLFFEIKTTLIDEFKERSSLIDKRDINDFNILDKLKNNNNENDLILIQKDLIFNPKKIIICTPSLSFGGGNQFVLSIYKVFKYIGFKVIIFPNDKKKNKFDEIINEDIRIDFSYSFINKFKPDYILFNSDISFCENYIENIFKITKIIFITHSDVAYSNFFIKNLNKYFYKILTVNNYTIEKLSVLLDLDKSKFFKLINYVNFADKNKENKENKGDKEKKENKDDKKIKKKYNFGVISRFSEDKNIPMLLKALIDIFKKYPNYKCYFVGTESEYYDNYLKNLVKVFDIEKNVIFCGFQSDVEKYYDIFDFIILPSVSEGCSYNIIESMNFALPVITSNVGGNHELIINNKNGIIYEYIGIRDFEKKTIYIENYNSQLNLIGYIINTEYFIYKYTIGCFIPELTKCKFNHNLIDNNCGLCKIINDKKKNFNNNVIKIKKSIFKMIEIEEEVLKEIKKNNIEFIKKNFNKNLYYSQIFELINT